jgi:hypothetical protein
LTRGLDEEENRDGRSGNDLGRGLPSYGGGIEERPRKTIFFASISPLIPGKTVVTLELD